MFIKVLFGEFRIKINFYYMCLYAFLYRTILSFISDNLASELKLIKNNLN